MQSRGFTHGDVPPVAGGANADALAAARRRTAWLLWGAFCVTLGTLYLAGWKFAPPSPAPAALPLPPFFAVAALSGLIALGIRGARGRQAAPGHKFTLLLLGLAFGESVALIGFVLHRTGSMPRHATWFLAAAGLLHVLQAPVDFSGSAATSATADAAPPGVTTL